MRSRRRFLFGLVFDLQSISIPKEGLTVFLPLDPSRFAELLRRGEAIITNSSYLVILGIAHAILIGFYENRRIFERTLHILMDVFRR